MRVVIFHFESNYYNNPSLDAIMKCLIFEEFRVTYVSKIKESDRRDRNIDFISINPILLKLFYLASEKLASSALTNLISKIILGRLDLQKVSAVIGVDREGLLVANQAALKFKIPKVFLSYEIFFEKETSKKFKKLEILASKNTDLWVVQDEIRMQCLLKENLLEIENCFILPIGSKGSKSEKIEKLNARKQKTEHDTKYVVLIGSVTNWTMAQELIESTTDWPPGWKLILHDRYLNYKNIKQNKLGTKVIISRQNYKNFDELNIFLQNFHIGVAFYKLGSDKFTGLNLKFLGRASGKIATYARAGLPVITNWPGLTANDLIDYSGGMLIKNPSEISKLLKNLDLIKYEKGADRYFQEVVDFNIYEKDLLQRIKKIVN